MSDKRIDSYFSPVSQALKRAKPSSSPEAYGNMEQDKVGEMTQGQLMASISASLSSLLDSKLAQMATKEDLTKLTSQLAELKVENNNLKEEVSRLKSAERAMAAKLIDLEARSRRNNLIFRGLKWTPQTRDFKTLIGNFCAEKFGTEHKIWINRAHPLGRDSNSVIAQFPDDNDIEYIMSRVSQLKGTGFAVHRDYPSEVRHKRACLSAVRNEVERVAGTRRMPLMFDHLTIDGQRFTWEDGNLRAGQQDGLVILKNKFKHDFSETISSLREGVARNAKIRARERSTSEAIQPEDAQITSEAASVSGLKDGGSQ